MLINLFHVIILLSASAWGKFAYLPLEAQQSVNMYVWCNLCPDIGCNMPFDSIEKSGGEQLYRNSKGWTTVSKFQGVNDCIEKTGGEQLYGKTGGEQLYRKIRGWTAVKNPGGEQLHQKTRGWTTESKNQGANNCIANLRSEWLYRNSKGCTTVSKNQGANDFRC